MFIFFFSSRRRHTRLQGDWSSDVCSSDLIGRSAADPPQVEPLERKVLRQCMRARIGQHPPHLFFESAGLPEPEIGRASCRGSVEVSGGAGELSGQKWKWGRTRSE